MAHVIFETSSHAFDASCRTDTTCCCPAASEFVAHDLMLSAFVIVADQVGITDNSAKEFVGDSAKPRARGQSTMQLRHLA